MKKTITLLLLFSSFNGFCCTTCNKKLQEMIYNSTFLPNLLVMLSAFIALGIVVTVLSSISSKSYKEYSRQYAHAFALDPVPLSTAAMVLVLA